MGAEALLVVGDSMLDRCWEGSVERLSHKALTAPTQKIRAVCQRQKHLRVDFEQPVPAHRMQTLADLVIDLLPAHRWLLLSDYAKGSLTDCTGLIRRADGHG